MNRRKVLDDWLIASQETIAALQHWVRLLDQWRAGEPVEPADFAAASQHLHEAGLGDWAAEAGGHSLVALAQVLELEPGQVFAEDRLPAQSWRRG